MKTSSPHCVTIQEPPLSKFLFSDTRLAVFWLVVRVYVGLQWFESGWGKLHNPAWVGSDAGAALKGFVAGALAKTTGAHPDVPGWYAGFLQNFVLPNAGWFGYVIVWGEILVAIALILGLFTGIAAFFGTFMNMNFLLAGTVSINPVLIFWQMLLILAWRVAGWYGLDRYVLLYVGMPWSPGHLFEDDACVDPSWVVRFRNRFGFGGKKNGKK